MRATTATVTSTWFDEGLLPRCFILNEQHHVILVCSPRPGDPLNARFMPHAYANMLPPSVDAAVRELEIACDRESAESKTERIGNLQINVKPLHGPWGHHTTVVVEPAPA